MPALKDIFSGVRLPKRDSDNAKPAAEPSRLRKRYATLAKGSTDSYGGQPLGLHQGVPHFGHEPHPKAVHPAQSALDPEIALSGSAAWPQREGALIPKRLSVVDMNYRASGPRARRLKSPQKAIPDESSSVIASNSSPKAVSGQSGSNGRSERSAAGSKNFVTAPLALTEQSKPAPEQYRSKDSRADRKKQMPPFRDLGWNQYGDSVAIDINLAYWAHTLGIHLPDRPIVSNKSPGNSSKKLQERSNPQDRTAVRKLDGCPTLKRWMNNQDISGTQYESLKTELKTLQAERYAEREEQRMLQLMDELGRLEHAARVEEHAACSAASEGGTSQSGMASSSAACKSIHNRLEERNKATLAAGLAAAQARLTECTVCGDIKEPWEVFATAPTTMCTHPPQTCIECLQTWVASEFSTKGTHGIKCPDCPLTLEYADIQTSASLATFEAYDRLATRNALGSLDEFGWCLKPGCGSGQMNIDNNAFMDCASCGFKQCLTHKVPWHTGETCEQYEYRSSGQKKRDEKRKTVAMLDKVSKKCPNRACGWRIQKTSGCEHMTCRKCRHQFCWLCLCSHAEIKRIGNTAHAKDCKFHSDNIKPSWPFNAH
ncbi:uncharacterized protein LTR77_005686 [Saxophila tyrrhenica]|uniref:RBR-type E3 ubiquitin transferase n=1 Tax=Saxophila tyrrhenica TaxID=1690608 RepID=A0AAV9P9M1_9PEZI|nr:hypothetical protein LTR77_005686 [Saxophila tyrrhenica]